MEDRDLERVDEWAAATRAEEAAAGRMRSRWLRQQNQEEARFVGVLADVVERRLAVTVTSVSGHTYHGRLRTVGQDFVVLDAAGGGMVLLGMGALAMVSTGNGPLSGERGEAGDRRMVDELGDLATDRPRVRVVSRGGHSAAGTLWSVGTDVLVVALDGASGTLAYVTLSSLAEVALLRSG